MCAFSSFFFLPFLKKKKASVLLFMQIDPFWSVSFLSEEDKIRAGDQRIPSLAELLNIAKKHNISLIFDLKNKDEAECYSTVKTITKSSISPRLVS